MSGDGESPRSERGESVIRTEKINNLVAQIVYWNIFFSFERPCVSPVFSVFILKISCENKIL